MENNNIESKTIDEQSLNVHNVQSDYINEISKNISKEFPPEMLNEMSSYIKNLKLHPSSSENESSGDDSSDDDSSEDNSSFEEFSNFKLKKKYEHSDDDSEDDSDSDDDSEGDSEDDSDDDSDDYTDSEEVVKETKYKRDEVFGNDVYKNKLFENKFSAILDILEFTKENRGVSQKHVDDIYNHYLANPKEFIKPLDIICYIREDKESDNFYIADGQHRFTALKKLFEVNQIDRDLLYFIHDAKNEEEIRKIIKSLNSSNPVNSVYSFEKIPDFIKKIGSKYTNIFSENKNHNNDKMNDIKLRDHIEEIKLFSIADLGVDDIFNYLLEFNQMAKEQFLARPTKIAADKKLFDRIASTHQFYGLIYRDYTWVNEFYNYVKTAVDKKKPVETLPKEGEVVGPAPEINPMDMSQYKIEEVD